MVSPENGILHRSELDVKYYCRIKKYPDGSREILACSKPIFCSSGWEESDKWVRDSKGKRRGASAPESVSRSRRRAAAKLRDIALCTPFRYFVTLTLSPDQIDRYDIGAVVGRMRTWLDNRVRRNGLSYVLVPELHKDGAVHFHGFFNSADVGLIDSGTLDMDGWRAPRKPRSQKERERFLADGARVVYNIGDWSFGFTTAIEIYGNYAAAVGYCCKYLGKQSTKIGGRWYYSGGRLGSPDVEYSDEDYWTIRERYPDAYAFDVVEANAAFVAVRIGADEVETTS